MARWSDRGWCVRCREQRRFTRGDSGAWLCGCGAAAPTAVARVLERDYERDGGRVMGFSRVRGETRPDVYRFVEDERERQIASGYFAAHDDAVSLPDFGALILRRAAWLSTADGARPDEYRKALTEIAALAVAALESMDRRPGMR